MRSPRTTTKSSPCSPQLKKAHVQQWRPNTAERMKRKKERREGGRKERKKEGKKEKRKFYGKRGVEWKELGQMTIHCRVPSLWGSGTGKTNVCWRKCELSMGLVVVRIELDWKLTGGDSLGGLCSRSGWGLVHTPVCSFVLINDILNTDLSR